MNDIRMRRHGGLLFPTLVWLGVMVIVTASIGLAYAVTDEQNNGTEAKAEPKKGAPQITKTVPEMGSKDVDPDLKEILVTFDRDMDKGMSWTGSPPEFPPTDKKRPAKWIDKRTCMLPVKLEPETSYRVGINSVSFQNFCSVAGIAAESSEIKFTTKAADSTNGAETPQDKSPKIVKMEPSNDAMDVDPGTKELKVTFNIAMGDGSSWTGGGPKFPKVPQGMKPKWSRDGKTCTLPVILEPEHDYELGINSPSFKNFKSKAGEPAKPVVYRFRTSEAKK